MFSFIPPELKRQLDRIENLLTTALRKENRIMATIDDIVADEATLKNAVARVLSELANLKNNPSIPADVQDKIDAVHAALAADVQSINDADPEPAQQ